VGVFGEGAGREDGEVIKSQIHSEGAGKPLRRKFDKGFCNGDTALINLSNPVQSN
jgi:hypothetical protein